MSNERSKFLIPAAILLGFIILAGAVIWSLNAFSFRVAIVDINRISSESGLSKRLSNEIQQKNNELQAKISKAKTDAEKNTIEQEFEAFKAEKSNEFSAKVKDAIQKIAKQKGIKAVALPNAFVYTGEDITTQVINELK